MKRGKVIQENYQARLVEERLAQPAVGRCLHCDWTASGMLAETRAAHQKHREHEHPDAVSTRKPMHRRRIKVGTKPLEENIANARTEGAATWDGATL